MATVTRPSTALPNAKDEMKSAQVREWVNNIIGLIEESTITSRMDKNNVDFSSTDGIVVKDTANTITGLLSMENTSAAAGGARVALRVGHDPASGTPANGDGPAIQFFSDDVGGNETNIAQIDAVFSDVTDGSEDANIILKTTVNGTTTTAATINPSTFTLPGGIVIGSSASVTSVDTDISSVSSSDDTIASAKAIKTYVDAQITAGDLDFTTDSNGGAVDLDSQTFTIAGGTGVNTAGTGQTATVNIDAAQTGITSLLATDIKIGEDDQTKIDFEDANTINFYANNAKELVLSENSLTPGTSDGIALGTGSLMWSDLFLADASVINFNNSNMTLTHSSGLLTVGGGTLAATISTATQNTIDHDTLANFVANEHIDHTGVSIVSGTGLTGGGTIASSRTLNVVGGDGITANSDDIAITPAQTTITSILAADIKIGEDDETKIDFGTPNEIQFFANNAEQVYVADGVFGPQSDSDVDLGTTGVRFKDAFLDTLDIAGDLTLSAGADGALNFSVPSSIKISDNSVGALVIEEANNAYMTFITSNGSESVKIDKALNASVSATVPDGQLILGSTNVSSTAAELNFNDGAIAGTVVASKTVVVDTNKDIGNFRNLTLTGELDAATLDISGNADIDGIANLDNTDIDGTLAVDGTTISLDATTSLNIDNSNTSNGITIGTATSGVPVSIGHTVSEVTVNDNLTVTGTLASGVATIATGSTIGNLTFANGSITDSSGAITFVNENLTTTGTLAAGVATLATGSTIGNLTLANGSITDSSGAISFGNENLTTTGTLAAGATTIGGTLDFNSGTIDLSTQTVDVTLNAAVDALNFDSNTLSIDASNNRVGIGTAAPAVPLDVSGSGHTAKIGKAGTAATWLTSYNDGNTLHFGVEDSNGADIAVGSSAYAGVISSGDSSRALQFATSGTVRATISNAGNVGIGVTPAAWHASHSAVVQFGRSALIEYADVQMDLLHNAYYDGAYNKIADSTASRYTQSGGAHVWDTAATGTGTFSWANKMKLLADGKLGIGTAVPLEKLTVSGSHRGTSQNWQAQMVNTDSMAVDKGGGVAFGGSYTGTTGTYFASINGAKENSTDSNVAGYLALSTRVAAAAQVTERLRIDSTGNVGIGEAAPGALLHLKKNNGSAAIRMEREDTSVSSGTEIGGLIVTGGISSADTPVARMVVIADDTWRPSSHAEGANSSTRIDFEVTPIDATTDVHAMTLDSNGRLGINTQAPASLLHLHTTTAAPTALTISNSNADANGAYLKFSKTSASPADDDIVGLIDFYGENDNDQETRTALIYSQITDVTDGSEDGNLVFKTMVNGSLNETMTMEGGSVNLPNLSASSDVQTDGSKNLVTTSDERLKNADGFIENALSTIEQLTPRYFFWKHDVANGVEARQLGFFSQEVHALIPEAAPVEDDIWGLNTRALVAYLTAAVQELSAKINKLEN